ncbi:tail fiber assembly protein [Escherichia coli]|nr:tail fiber assembly protein [Escherichia coli]
MSVAPGLDMAIDEIAARDVPSGCEWIVVEAESLPPGGLQETWSIEDGAVVVDDEKFRSYLIRQAEADKKQRKLEADDEIEWRQYAADRGIATEEELSALEEWNLFRVLLMRVDTAAPVWPKQPER